MNTKRLSKRKCEMWISNNKVLVGGNKKPHARNPNFETEETRLLISLWGDPKVQKTLITTHKKHPVIMKLADQMREHGYLRSADEINTRIKNLKCFYNRIKKDVEMGIITEPTWKHYAAMDEIVTRPVFGNRHQQPHLQHLLQPAGPTMVVLGGGAATSSGGGVAGAVGGGSDLDSTDGLRPEDLLSVKGDEDADVDFEGATLVPKDEPVDMDEMAMDQHNSDMDDVNDIFPKLSQYLQLAAAASAKGGNGKSLLRLTAADVAKHHTPLRQPIQIPSPTLEIKQSPPSSPAPSSPSQQQRTNAATPSPTAQLLSALALTPTIVPVSAPPAMVTVPVSAIVGSAGCAPATTPLNIVAASAAASTTTTTTSSTLSKISLVPTNILMKPKVAALPATSSAANATPTVATPQPAATVMPMTNLRQPQSISFGGEQYVCANTVSNGKSVYTSQQKEGQPMKVLLVNTIQQPVPQLSVSAANMLMANSSVTPVTQSVAAGPHTTAGGSSLHINTNTTAAALMSGTATTATTAMVSSSSTAPTTVGSIAAAAAVVASSAASTATTMPPLKSTAAIHHHQQQQPSTRSSRAHHHAHKLSYNNAGSAAIASVVAEMENAAATAAAAAAVAAAKTRSRSSAAAAAKQAALMAAVGIGGGPLRSSRRTVQPVVALKAPRNSHVTTGFRTLLQHLITLQTDTLATSRQRLEVEQQRLSFEQTMGDKLLTALQTLTNNVVLTKKPE